MSTLKQSESKMNEGKSILQNERVRKVILYAAIVLFVFLIGLVPIVDNVSGPGS